MGTRLAVSLVTALILVVAVGDVALGRGPLSVVSVTAVSIIAIFLIGIVIVGVVDSTRKRPRSSSSRQLTGAG